MLNELALGRGRTLIFVDLWCFDRRKIVYICGLNEIFGESLLTR